MNGSSLTNVSQNSATNNYVKDLINILNFYYPIVLTFLCIVGNTISYMVFSTRKFRNNASSFFIKIKLINDFLNVCICTWRYLYLAVTGVELKNISVFWCYTSLPLVYIIDPCSSWLNVLTSFDRLFLVLKPSKYKSLPPKKIRNIQIVTIVGMYLSLGLVISLTRTISITYTVDVKILRDNTTLAVTSCGTVDSIAFTIANILNLLLSIILPFLAMAISSSIIAFILIKSKLKMSSNKKNISQKNVTFIKTVLCLDVFFLVFNLPRFVIQLIAKYDNYWQLLALQCATIFKYVYYSISIVFFLSINGLFRETLFSIWNLNKFNKNYQTGL